ncbi:MAG TPA: sigma-70 family RNA polymerase sigma factor [Solirubrobacteraceae bacterium]|nr:sigma-70 family RNA polymerase sigma factor [Solirubrobacteraceae bacterium]
MVFHVSDSEWVIGSAQPATSSRRLPFGLGRLADERLAQLVAAGRDRAFAVLYERYHQPLYRYCRSMLRNDQDAQDALQSTFASALAALQEGKRNAPFRPWLFRIAHNESVTVIRRRRDAGHEISDSVLPPAASASDEADDRARMALLLADLAQLPERQRAALLMRELSGLSHAEISVALATSVTAAKQAIFDARTALTEFAEGRALDCDEVRRKISERDGRVLRSRRVRSHLRECSSCASFAGAISERRSDLRAIAPLLPAAASAALLARLGSSTSGYAGGGSAGGAGAAGKLGTAAIASKTAVGATVVVTAAAGLGALPKMLTFIDRPSAPSAHASPVRPTGTVGAAVRSQGATLTAPGVLSRPVARLRTKAVPRSHQHHAPASAKHGVHGGASARSGSAAPHGTAPPRSVASPAPSAHGKSGLPHGKSGLSHGKSSQPPAHTKVAGTGSATANKAKPVHAPPGQTGTAGRSASSTGHLKSAKAKSNAAATTTATSDEASTSPPRGQRPK